MSIFQNLKGVHENLAKEIELVVVSKFQPVERLQEAYDCGERLFGESRPQELVKKFEIMPKDIKWHMIGALQTNKVKYIVPFIDLIHSGTSAKLFDAIDKEASKCGKIVDVLIELHVAKEESKQGWSKAEILEYLDSGDYKSLKNIRFRGVMAMASFSSDESLVSSEFKDVKGLFYLLKTEYFNDNLYFDIVSMGMSGDYQSAIKEGATMVRIGSSIFK